MITREMIRNGFESGTVSIEEEYAGCIGICCRIGDNAFYFLGSEDDDLTKEEYYRANKLLFFPKDKLEWLVKAAELGHHQAQYEAGKFFYLQRKIIMKPASGCKRLSTEG